MDSHCRTGNSPVEGKTAYREAAVADCHERTVMPDMDDIKQLADEHDKQVDEGLEKAGDEASAKFGHESQIDKGVDWAQQNTGSGDQDSAADDPGNQQ